MPNILIAEGTPTLWQTEHAGFAVPSNFSLFATAVQLHDPGIRRTLINIADGGALPFGTALSDFDGVMILTSAKRRPRDGTLSQRGIPPDGLDIGCAPIPNLRSAPSRSGNGFSANESRRERERARRGRRASVGSGVRIGLPPAASPQTLGPSM
jgi:hypothetical protein